MNPITTGILLLAATSIARLVAEVATDSCASLPVGEMPQWLVARLGVSHHEGL